MSEKQTFIYLYADEFKDDIWRMYMNILGLKSDTQEVKITVANAESMDEEK